MHECPVNHPALPALFDPAVPNQPALWAVLAGRHTGRAVVDDRVHPSQCVLRTDAALTYHSRRITPAFLEQAVSHFRQAHILWLVWPPTAPAELREPAGAQSMPRLEFFEYDPESPVLADWRRRLPAGCEIRPIDAALLERCAWRDDMAFYCGSPDNFLAHALGLCLMHGDEILTEAYASSFGDRTAEIGAVTREAHRGRGYAPIACAYLIEACERRGYRAYWSCDADNPASIRVARKLGFRQERPYRILEYPPFAVPA